MINPFHPLYVYLLFDLYYYAIIYDLGPIRLLSKKHRKKLSSRMKQTHVTDSYLAPLMTSHFIDSNVHISPLLKFPKPPSPFECAKNTSISRLVSHEETYDISNDFSKLDKFAIIAADNYKLNTFLIFFIFINLFVKMIEIVSSK